METAFRLFMYLLPYAVSIALFVWMFRRVQRVPNKTAKMIALLFVAVGFGYTVYHMAGTIGKALSDDTFHFAILIITVFVLFFAAIAMAFGEPEK